MAAWKGMRVVGYLTVATLVMAAQVSGEERGAVHCHEHHHTGAKDMAQHVADEGDPHVHCHAHSAEDNHGHEHPEEGVYKHCHEHHHSAADNHGHDAHFDGEHSHCHSHTVRVLPPEEAHSHQEHASHDHGIHHHHHDSHLHGHHHHHEHDDGHHHHAHDNPHQHEHHHSHGHDHQEEEPENHDHSEHGSPKQSTNDHHGHEHHHHHHHHVDDGSHEHGHHAHGHAHAHSHAHEEGEGHSCSHAHEHHGEHGHGRSEINADECPVGKGGCEKKSHVGESGEDAWTSAILGTLFITFGGNSAILLFYWWTISDATLRVMVLFAVGGLLGDVFLHLLPHALEATAGHEHHHGDGHGHGHAHHHGHGHGGDSHDHSHDMSVGLAVIAGILCFFLIEKMLRGAQGHGHSHAGGGSKKNEEKRIGIQPGAVLNMVADAAHNFTDGMAIAAAYQVSRSTGTVMTVAVFFHEIPHEVGDFAVLLKQGMSRRQAFAAQFVSAIGAILGCLFGLSFSSAQPTLVLSFTAGGFIYVSLANIIPDVLEHPSGLVESFQQVLAFSAGVFMMVLIAMYEP